LVFLLFVAAAEVVCKIKPAFGNAYTVGTAIGGIERKLETARNDLFYSVYMRYLKFAGRAKRYLFIL
jgi:hypothetical protein